MLASHAAIPPADSRCMVSKHTTTLQFFCVLDHQAGLQSRLGSNFYLSCRWLRWRTACLAQAAPGVSPALIERLVQARSDLSKQDAKEVMEECRDVFLNRQRALGEDGPATSKGKTNLVPFKVALSVAADEQAQPQLHVNSLLGISRWNAMCKLVAADAWSLPADRLMGCMTWL